MKSMTGYGWAEAHSSEVHIEVSIRTVNGRYLEPRFHLPKEYLSLENALKKKLSEFIYRGTIDIFVSRKSKSQALAKNVVLNRELAKKYHESVRSLAKELKSKEVIRIESLLRMPEVLHIEEVHRLSGTEKKALLTAFEKACANCASERKREGKSLRLDLENCLKDLEKEVLSISAIREKVNGSLAEKFEQRLKAKLVSMDMDSSRLAQEIALLLEKSDISEEITRLGEHFDNYRNLIQCSSPIGKKMDFYTQELLREVNTIGSKSQVSELTHHVVQAKTYIERLREQVQNIE